MATQAEDQEKHKEDIRETIDETEERVLLSWSSLEKPFQERTKDFYSTVLVLAVLVGIVLFFIEGIMPVLVIAAIVFFLFISNKSRPEMTEHVFTNQGVTSAGQKYSWSELIVFWTEKSRDLDIIHILTTRRWPARLILIGPSEGKVTIREIKEVLLAHLPYEQPVPGTVDKAMKWFSEKVPLEG